MNAQEKWKYAYAEWRRDSLDDFRHNERYYRAKMIAVRREAALERALEASQRKVKRLQELLDAANYAVWRDRL